MKLTTLAEAALALAPYGFDAGLQDHFMARAAQKVDNAVRGALEPMAEATLSKLPPINSRERAELREEGLQLLRERKVGVVVLAGGMATRFGGVVKAVVPARGRKSFLELKYDDIRAVSDTAGAAIPTYVMSSFATHEVIRAHVRERRMVESSLLPIQVFPQYAALRLTPQGELFRDAEGLLSPHATGHGDLTFALRQSGLLADFRDAGGTMLFMTNVDNLGATLDPAMVALHARGGGAITAEVVRKYAGDAGGAPALLDGVPQIIEGFRFPADFDQARIGVFNTNTFMLDAAAIDRDVTLPYYRVEKKVGGAPVIQFERLVGELTAHLPTRFVEVEREGADCRFLAVKEPSDLERQEGLIERVTRSARSHRDLVADELR